jgi:hypothetical protein
MNELGRQEVGSHSGTPLGHVHPLLEPPPSTGDNAKVISDDKMLMRIIENDPLYRANLATSVRSRFARGEIKE